VESLEEFLDILEISYRINKHSLLLPCHHPETEEVVHTNMRMGINLTGLMQASKEQLSWLDTGYEHLRRFDEEYSARIGVPTSIKLTTIQPSGTMSLLPGVTSGVHPAYAQYMIRRIRIASSHALVKQCRDRGYPIEYARQFDGTSDYSTSIISIPFAYPEGTVLAKDITAIDMLEFVKKMQRTWSDNAVSCSIYYDKEELPEIIEYLRKNYTHGFKTLSFFLKSDHGFQQAPIEEISKKEYLDLMRKITPITDVMDIDVGDDECASGHCPIR
jgi:ribonucleoside-triphosphate reductase